MNSDRRTFMRNAVCMAGALLLCSRRGTEASAAESNRNFSPLTTVYRARNGTPAENMRRVLTMLGGVPSFVQSDDVVVIKPNVQWYNQGAPNLLAVKTLVDAIFTGHPDFSGEVVIAENIHRGREPWDRDGWKIPFVRNADCNAHNFNELCSILDKKYGDRFSTCHLIDVAAGGKRIYTPDEGKGYIWCDGTGGTPLLKTDNGCTGTGFRETIMSYPVCTTRRGTIIDFKNGVHKQGTGTGGRLCLINFAGLNHHSYACGATMSVKNYMGICDLTGGQDPASGGKMSGDYYNFHSFAFNKYAAGPGIGALGTALGTFMKTIRKADMNFISAEWTGLASRTEQPVAHTRTICAGIDPVALDYHASKYILYANSGAMLHNPDATGGPLHEYLKACAAVIGSIFDERYISVQGFDCASGQPETNGKSPVKAPIIWGRDPKSLLKHIIFRFIAP